MRRSRTRVIGGPERRAVTRAAFVGTQLRTPVALGALLLAGALAGFLGGLSRFLGRSLSHGEVVENIL